MRRGFALLEVMVASALGLLALTILVSALIPLSRASQRSLQEVELSQITSLIVNRISRDLQTTPPQGINNPAPGPLSYFSIQSVEAVSAGGKAAFAEALIVYEVDLAHGRLRRRLASPGDLTLDYPKSYGLVELQTSFTGATAPLQTLASGVLTDFQLSSLSADRRELKRLHLVLKSNLSSYRYDETIALRNGDL